ncbi:hypothetical protein BYT27DRAFT_7173549 [Phlegmacium glaucopus]|nr:hypothetical protein BYT27DRAFT_7173549 [Phlegmacium glaucopus]
MSIHESYDDFCTPDVDFQAHQSPCLPATRPSASDVPLNNDLLRSPSPVLSMLSETDLPPTLDSFIPILRLLPGLYLDQNLYHIRGSITTKDWERVHHYSRSVSKFILRDISNKDSKAQISPAAFLRLARLQQPDMPLIPSLTDIVIAGADGADASLSYLELLVTPWLKSLEVLRIPDAQQPTLFSFLTAIQQEAPLLQTIIFGSGRFPSSSLQIISKFDNLRHFELKHEGSEIPSTFFDDIGSLPKLETFILDARHVSNNVSENQSNSMNEMVEDVNSLPSHSFPDSNSTDSNRYQDGAGDVPHSQTCHTPISTSGTFNQLAKLHVVGWLPLLKDLIPRIMSTVLQDVSITLIRSSDGELQVNLAKEEVDQDRRAEQQPEQQQIGFGSGNPFGQSPQQIGFGNGNLFGQPQQQQIGFGSGFGQPQEEQTSPFGNWAGESNYSSKKKGNLKARQLREAEEKKLKEEQEMQKKLLKEQERLARVAFYTVSFTELLQTLCSRWTASLKAVSVSQSGESFRRLLEPPTLPEETFLELLLLPAIENLEVKGWMLDSIESVLEVIQPLPNLRSLLLPLDETNSGISLFTLRHVAETCLKLESFQCRIESLSRIPEYTVPTTGALSHGLRLLSVGNSSPLSNTKQLKLIARHLYLLFPHLETISTSEEHNAEQWAIVDELVKMCQTARMDDSNRPSITQ